MQFKIKRSKINVQQSQPWPKPQPPQQSNNKIIKQQQLFPPPKPPPQEPLLFPQPLPKNPFIKCVYLHVKFSFKYISFFLLFCFFRKNMYLPFLLRFIKKFFFCASLFLRCFFCFLGVLSVVTFRKQSFLKI